MSDDQSAYRIIYDAINEALALDVSPGTHRRLVRLRGLAGALGGIPHVGVAGAPREPVGAQIVQLHGREA